MPFSVCVWKEPKTRVRVFQRIYYMGLTWCMCVSAAEGGCLKMQITGCN